jgi:hypothetical protein
MERRSTVQSSESLLEFELLFELELLLEFELELLLLLELELELEFELLFELELLLEFELLFELELLFEFEALLELKLLFEFEAESSSRVDGMTQTHFPFRWTRCSLVPPSTGTSKASAPARPSR